MSSLGNFRARRAVDISDVCPIVRLRRYDPVARRRVEFREAR
ncbi:hypothetical protein [Micromonospora sp. CPCC 205561]